MKHKILTAALLVILSSCMKIKKKDSELPTAPAPAVIQMNNQVIQSKATESLQYNYEADQFSGLHKVRFTAALNWPKAVVLKKTDGEKVQEFAIEFNEEAVWSDLIISENKVNYKFFSKVESQLIPLDEVEVLPVLKLRLIEDLNLAQKYKLDQKTKVIYISSLEIGLQKHLYLEEFSGQIIIENIKSDSGFIQTFPLGARAALDVEGRSGGVLDVIIKSGSGILNIFMRGENGGKGRPAHSADSTLKGTIGAAGTPAEFKNCRIIDSGYGINGALCSCSQSPAPGGKGGRGLKGFSGHDGKSAGHSGTATIFSNSRSLQLLLNAQEGSMGVGSQGGMGGDGGDGGMGGDGAEKDFKIRNQSILVGLDAKCDMAGNGAAGDIGDFGSPGSNGNDGLKQKSCLYQVGEKEKCIFN